MAVGKGLTATFNSVSVGKVIDISIGGCVVATTDSSHQGLTADTNGVCWREHESSGFAEPGDVSIKCLFDGVLPALGTTASLVIGWGSVLNKQWTFALSIYTGFDPVGNLGQEQVVSLKFKLSGKPTVAALSGGT